MIERMEYAALSSFDCREMHNSLEAAGGVFLTNAFFHVALSLHAAVFT